MTRRRINEGLPKYVYRIRGWYVYRPYLGREDGKTVFGKDQRLCKIGSSVRELHERYDAVTSGGSRTDLQWMLASYQQSPQFLCLKSSTQADYDRFLRDITGTPMKGGRTWGEMPLTAVKKTHIRNYLDSYKGGEHPTAANHRIQYLKAAWNWAEERHEQVPANPCTGVRLNRTVPRTRYVGQEEFQAFAAACPPKSYIPVAMELAYLCRARWSEVADLKVQDCAREGVIVRRGKGSDSEITAWTPRLKDAVSAAKRLWPCAPTPVSGAFLIHDRRGLRVGRNGFQSAWRRAMNKWLAAGGEHFTFHDLKAAGYSDQKKQDAGHKSEKMHNVYNRKLRIVEPAE